MNGKSLQEIMVEHPNLCFVGYPKVWLSVGSEELLEWRELLAADVEQFEKARAWIAENLKPCKRINKYCSSYTLKHICERCTGYITNGTFIAAMIANGFDVRTFYGSPNPCFNVTTSSIEDADMTDASAATP